MGRDRDRCGRYHYHARIIHDGTTHVFLGCVSGVTAKSNGGGGASAGGGGGMPQMQGGSGMPQMQPPAGQSGASIGGNTMAASGKCPGGQAKCCGDKICDGPETVMSCPSDCSTAAGSASSYYVQPAMPQQSGEHIRFQATIASNHRIATRLHLRSSVGTRELGSRVQGWPWGSSPAWRSRR